MKKLVSVLLVCMLLAMTAVPAFADSEPYDLVRFLPTKITVSYKTIKVEGYFVNMNSNRKVNYIKDFKLYVYKDGSEIVSADFSGQTVECSMNAYRMTEHSFTINGSHNLNYGTYYCDDSYTAQWYGTLNSTTTY